MTPDYGAVYDDTRKRLAALVLTLSEDELDYKVPATPAWTVKELVAHFTGIAEDIVAGNIEGAGTEEWTAAQVARRSERPVEELIGEWEEMSEKIVGALGFVGRTMAGLLAGDVVVHEHDLRGAVGKPGGRDSVGVMTAVDTYAFRFRRRVEEAPLPPLVISDGRREWRWGEQEPAATVTGAPFELLRALTGRRTPIEIQENLIWRGESSPYIPLFPLYGIPESSLGE